MYKQYAWLLKRYYKSYSLARSQERHSRHAVMNNIIHCSLVSAKISSHLAPFGPSRSDGRRPDGMSMVLWTSRKLLVWDASCSDSYMYAPSNINNGVAITGAGAVAEKSAAAAAQDIQIFTSALNLCVYSCGSWDF